MKKIHVILLSMIVLLLCGCAIDPATYYFDADDIKNQATKIQLVICENNNPVIVDVKEVNSPVGYTVLIYMQNQEIIVLSCTIINGIGYGMVSVFSNDGNFIRHIAQFADEPKYKRLLTNYFVNFNPS